MFILVLNPISLTEERYNKTHEQTRKIIECTFGTRKHSKKLTTTLLIIAAVAVLHNISREKKLGDLIDNDDIISLTILL